MNAQASEVHDRVAGLGNWPARRAFLCGDRVALIDGDRRLTYVEFDRRTDQLARALRANGVQQGDRVAGLMVNSSAFLETMFAVAKLEFVLELPRNATGKVLKTTLRTEYGGQGTSVPR